MSCQYPVLLKAPCVDYQNTLVPPSFRRVLVPPTFLHPSQSTPSVDVDLRVCWTMSVTTVTMSVTTVNRTLIGPLTTTFTPPKDCPTPFNWAFVTEQVDLDYYGVNCVSERSCFPGVGTEPTTFPAGGIFSPGLYCPSGWETAATIDSRLTELQSQLQPDESAVLCCPRCLDHRCSVC